jgi:hypothetical protein
MGYTSSLENRSGRSQFVRVAVLHELDIERTLRLFDAVSSLKCQKTNA